MAFHKCPRCGWSDSVGVREAAAMLGVSHQTVVNWIKSGRLVGAVREAVPGGSRFRFQIPVTSIEAARVKQTA